MIGEITFIPLTPTPRLPGFPKASVFMGCEDRL